jgi:hypothetical protein
LALGLSVAQIGRAFLVTEDAMEQRITRAKRHVASAELPFEAPDLTPSIARCGRDGARTSLSSARHIATVTRLDGCIARGHFPDGLGEAPTPAGRRAVEDHPDVAALVHACQCRARRHRGPGRGRRGRRPRRCFERYRAELSAFMGPASRRSYPYLRAAR